MLGVDHNDFKRYHETPVKWLSENEKFLKNEVVGVAKGLRSKWWIFEGVNAMKKIMSANNFKYETQVVDVNK